MPVLLVHLKVAQEYAKDKLKLKDDASFYLGNIIPDSVLSRKTNAETQKAITHLFTTRESWEMDTLNKFHAIEDPTPFEIGYYMHVLTDIQFRNKMRRFYDDNNVPYESRDQWDRIFYPINIRRLFESLDDYYELLKKAEDTPIFDYPYGIKTSDVNGEFVFGRQLFDIYKIVKHENEIELPLPNYQLFIEEIVSYLLRLL